ncbi:MAG: ribonuclease P protein component [Gammaproteobacteria bacterium]
MSNTYPWKLRLLTPQDFQTVYRNARRVTCHKSVILVKINGQNHPRLGISLPKKVVPIAVQRNRIKRVIRESFRLQQNSLKGLDIIVVVKQKIELADSNFKMSLTEQWKKLVLKS